jgi:hypothetical protein
VLFLKIIAVYLVLWAVVWAFTRFFHQALYTQVPNGLLWRSAAAAGILWVWGLVLPVVCKEFFD